MYAGIWMKSFLLITLLCISTLAMAHTSHDKGTVMAVVIPAAIESARVDMRIENGKRIFTANGIPNHTTGQFPNRGNPNSISSQNYRYEMPASPQLSGSIKHFNMGKFGIALNGIPFDPATAECYGKIRGQIGSGNCDWKEEAIVNGRGQLGLDSSNAHVQPNGAYHYHGIPNGLLASLPAEDIVKVGYAADGFPVMVSKSAAFKSGYQLKTGTRPGGANAPSGQYDGSYTADFEFVNTSDLDECNGTMIGGQYTYILTREFPYIPRCFKGTPDSSFDARGRGQGNDNMMMRRGEDGMTGRRPPPRRF